MDFEKAFGVDEQLLKAGVDVRFGADCFITLKHAGPTNREYQAALTERVTRNWSAFNGHDRLAAQEAIAQEIFAEQIVIGWRGVELDSQELPFNRENVLKLFRRFPVVWERVQLEAGRLSNFQREAVGSAGKQ